VIQLQIVSGKQAGSDVTVRQFPLVIGREAAAGLRLDDSGVWDSHLEIQFDRSAGFSFQAGPNALTLVNGERVESGVLRNGDTIELGSVQLRFWLARTQQETMRVREILTWAALLAIFAVQIGLICWLLS
jgi:pSer/pThr/pTyr-binding forkhead associated (FHA) protein